MDRITAKDFNWVARALAGQVDNTRGATQYWLDLPHRFSAAPLRESDAKKNLRQILAQKNIDPLIYVRALLACGADPLIPGDDGATALMLAAHSGHLDVIRLLLPLSAPLAQNERKQTALFLAASEGHAEAVALLLPHSDANARDDSGRNALMRTYRNRAEMTKLLLPATDPLAVDDEGLTALAWAARLGDAESVQMLLPVSDPATADHADQTPLIWAVRAVSPGCVALLAPHCDVNAKTQTSLETFLGSPINAKGPKLAEWRDAFGLAALTKAWNCADLLAPRVDMARVREAVVGAPDGYMLASRALIERHELAQAIAPLGTRLNESATDNNTEPLDGASQSMALGRSTDKKPPHRL